MPKITFESTDAVPEGLKEYAKEEGGKFIVDVAPAVKVTEFRDNNVRLAQERDVLKAFRDTLSPIVGEDVGAFVTSFQEMNGIVTQVKDGKLKGTDAIEAEVLNRVGQMKTGYESQQRELAQKLTVAETRAAQADNRYRRSIVDQAVTQAVIADASGALPTALPDILGRAYQVFQVSDDGKVIAKDGDAVIYGADGATPMTPMEWVTGKLRDTAPYFFKNSSGGGATGGGTAGDARFGGKTEKEYRSMTAEQKLALANDTALKSKRA